MSFEHHADIYVPECELKRTNLRDGKLLAWEKKEAGGEFNFSLAYFVKIVGWGVGAHISNC